MIPNSLKTHSHTSQFLSSIVLISYSNGRFSFLFFFFLLVNLSFLILIPVAVILCALSLRATSNNVNGDTGRWLRVGICSETTRNLYQRSYYSNFALSIIFHGNELFWDRRARNDSPGVDSVRRKAIDQQPAKDVSLMELAFPSLLGPSPDQWKALLECSGPQYKMT